MAFQFVHLECFARKADKGGRSVSWILDEAERRLGATPHVEHPKHPKVVFGCPIDEVRRQHDDAVMDAKVVLANGRRRAVRQDQKTLVTVVASHPATMEEVSADPKVQVEYEAWEARTVQWLREQYGENLVSVIRHEDETYGHIHAYILPRDMRASRLHPGAEAKRLVKEAGAREGEDAKALNRRGDAAYKRAMREWQDSYWRSVGLPSGQTRFGPRKRRLTREESKAEQAACASVMAATEKAASIGRQASRYVENTKAKATQIISEAQAIETAAIEQAETVKRLHDAAMKQQQQAKSMLSRAKSEASRILDAARSEAARAMSWGRRLRGFLEGLQRSSIEEAARRDAAEGIERERARADEMARRAIEEAQRRRQAERLAADSAASARSIGIERDQARRELAMLRPNGPAAGVERGVR
jgi:hypothetical protein